MAQVEHPEVAAIGDFLSAGGVTHRGELSSRFATAEGSSYWYRGAVVAYSSD